MNDKNITKKFTGEYIDPITETVYHYKNGMLHNEGKPSIIYKDGVLEYYFEDKLHRTDGPAIIRPNGGNSYYLDGKYILAFSDQEFIKYLNSIILS